MLSDLKGKRKAAEYSNIPKRLDNQQNDQRVLSTQVGFSETNFEVLTLK